MIQEEIYRRICAGENVRANLIELKSMLKEDGGREQFRAVCGDRYDVIMKCLSDDDPKVRKNAAAILGILKAPDAVDVLMDAYEAEETLFVRPEYVTALSELDCKAYLPDFHRRLETLRSSDVPEQEKKHTQAEIAALQELILKKEGQKKHKFSGYNRANQVILTTAPAFREALAADIPFRKTLLKSGVRTTVTDLSILQTSRLWQEMLFVINSGAGLSGEPEILARQMKETDLLSILTENHKGDLPFLFRVGVAGAIPKEKRSRFAKNAAAAIETVFEGALLNSVSHYEIEIRLIVGRDGHVTPLLKLFTLPDRRFNYRKYSVASGMKPQTAAGILALAKPYLREYAQVLDPFCGVGTLLLERGFLTPVRSAYGIDIYGEAIRNARANTKLTGMPVNYINRDFFDFTHSYLFDEIITDMPVDFTDRAQADTFYRRFFEKAESLLTEHGRVICYSREMGLVKKYLRLRGTFRLLAEFCITEKSGAHLFLLEKIRKAA
ncbi:MAG: methyltransferase domain-containing protein [Clostridiales bacterium]|nr:methyltransferase domain-containing protein [Clostridiales bacterium]